MPAAISLSAVNTHQTVRQMRKFNPAFAIVFVPVACFVFVAAVLGHGHVSLEALSAVFQTVPSAELCLNGTPCF